jgi:hypothetical protein
MGGDNRPFLYGNLRDSRLPDSTFDPKAVTRASWDVKPPKPKPNGPLLSFNTHPEYERARTPFRRGIWLTIRVVHTKFFRGGGTTSP